MAISFSNPAAFRKAAEERRLGKMAAPQYAGKQIGGPSYIDVYGDASNPLATSQYSEDASGNRRVTYTPPAIDRSTEGADRYGVGSISVSPSLGIPGAMGEAADRAAHSLAPTEYFDVGGTTPGRSSLAAAKQDASQRQASDVQAMTNRSLAADAGKIKVAEVEAGGKEAAAKAGQKTDADRIRELGLHLLESRMKEKAALAQNAIVAPKPITDEEFQKMIQDSFSEAAKQVRAGSPSTDPNGGPGIDTPTSSNPGLDELNTLLRSPDAPIRARSLLAPPAQRPSATAPSATAPRSIAAPPPATSAPAPRANLPSQSLLPTNQIAPRTITTPDGRSYQVPDKLPNMQYAQQQEGEEIDALLRRKYGVGVAEAVREFLKGVAKGSPHPSNNR